MLLLGALAGHKSLHELNVSHNFADTSAKQAVAGAVLAALVAANAPALHTLDISFCSLGDAGFGLLMDALPQNTHLHTLHCADNDITEDFVRNRVRPAVQANTSLHKLILADDEAAHPAHLAIMRERKTWWRRARQQARRSSSWDPSAYSPLSQR